MASSWNRLAAFSDGVIAIAITILVLGLEVPSVHEVPKSRLVDYLRESIHPSLGFVLSFLLIGTYWLQHYAIFHFLTRSTRVLIALNGMFLLCVTFLPFPTGLQATYRDDKLAMVLYGVAQLSCGLSLLAMWLYAAWDYRLVSPKVSRIVMRSMTRRLLIVPGLSLAAIGFSFINLWASRLILSINERIHLRLWRTDLSLAQQPVWIGQISRDIGVRFTPKTWNLTTHRIDPEVDEARDYVVDYLLGARRVSRFGYVAGVEAAPAAAPRRNLTGDPYYTDGNRAVLILAPSSTSAEYLAWS